MDTTEAKSTKTALSRQSIRRAMTQRAYLELKDATNGTRSQKRDLARKLAKHLYKDGTK